MKDLFPIPMLMENLKAASKYNLFYSITQARKLRSHEVNDYTSYYDKNPMQGVHEWLGLKEIIMEHGNRYCNDSGITKRIEGINAWWNVYGYGNHHCWHAHSSAILSGTFYVNVPDDARPVEFKSPVESLIKSWQHGAFDHTRFAQHIELYPKTNDLLIWPSWLEHNIPEIKSSPEERVTISFNLLDKKVQKEERRV